MLGDTGLTENILFFLTVTLKSQKMPSYTKLEAVKQPQFLWKKIWKIPNHKKATTKRWCIRQIPSCNIPFRQQQLTPLKGVSENAIQPFVFSRRFPSVQLMPLLNPSFLQEAITEVKNETNMQNTQLVFIAMLLQPVKQRCKTNCQFHLRKPSCQLNALSDFQLANSSTRRANSSIT